MGNSGLNLQDITAMPGIIDSDYETEIQIVAHSMDNWVSKPGDYVA